MPSFNIQISVEPDIAQAVNQWRLTQTIDDGQGGTTPMYANTDALLVGILQDAVERILDQTPTAAIQAEIDAIAVSTQIIKDIKDNCVTT